MSRKLATIKALNEWQKRDFSYGDADCCQFVAHVIKYISHKDYSDVFTYSSEQEANQIISNYGSLQAFITSILGEPADQLQDGDPVLSKFPIIGEALGVKLEQYIVCLTDKGMVRMYNKHQVCGWSICLK